MLAVASVTVFGNLLYLLYTTCTIALSQSAVVVALQRSQWSATDAVIPCGNGPDVQGRHRRKIQQFVYFRSYKDFKAAVRISL